MKRRSAAILLVFCAVIALAAASCGGLRSRPASLPCDDAHLALYPAIPADSVLELSGRARVEIGQYRFRGICRILYAPAAGMRVDFEHSALFGAIHRRLTLFCADTLLIVDPDAGTSIGADSSLAILRGALGAAVEPDDVLYALLLLAPRCGELAGGALAPVRGGMRLEGTWRGRELVLTAGRGKGPREMRQRFPGLREGFVVRYDSYEKGDRPAYPRRITLRRESGPDRVTLELTDIEVISFDPTLFAPEWYGAVSRRPGAAAQGPVFAGTSATPGCIR